MHRVLIVGGEPDLQQRIEALLAEAGSASALTALDHPPGEIELTRILKTQRPDIFLVVIQSLLAITDFMHRMMSSSPSTPVLALSQYTDSRTVRELMALGFKGLIPLPLVRASFIDTFRDATGGLRNKPQEGEILPQLTAFLPGKGGSGTSRLACHFALSLAADAARRGGQRVLLLDLDMTSGLIRYLFDRTSAHSLVEMIESGVALNGPHWHQMVSRHGNLDIVHGGRPNPRHPLSPAKMRQVLEAAASDYCAICADLSGNIESFSLEVLHRSARIFVVTSTDPGTVLLAKERIQFLDRLGVGRRVGLLLNRFHGLQATQAGRIAAEIGAPLAGEFDFDDRKVLESMQAARPFDDRMGISRAIAEAAQRLVWQARPPHDSRGSSRT